MHAYEPDGSELPAGRSRPVCSSRPTATHSAPGFTAVGRPHEPLARPGDRRPRRRRQARGDLGRRRPHLRLGGRRQPRRPGSRSNPIAAICTPDKQSQPLHHPKCGFLATPGDRLPRRPRPAALDRRSPGSTACSTRSDADGTERAGLPGPPRRSRRAGERADDRRVDQRPRDRRPRRRRQGRHRHRHQRELRRRAAERRRHRRLDLASTSPTCWPTPPAARAASTRSTAPAATSSTAGRSTSTAASRTPCRSSARATTPRWPRSTAPRASSSRPPAARSRSTHPTGR